MSHSRTFLLTGLAGFLLLVPVPLASAQQSATVQLRVKLPPDARLEIDGVRTRQAGPERLFESPPVPVGKTYTYTVVATWNRRGQPVVRREVVKVTPGKEIELDLREPAPTGQKRVKQEQVKAPLKVGQEKKDKPPEPDKEPDVIFVPTPQAVVDKMLEMAKVKRGDIVYDLGCGDGRIVVSAAKKGAKATGFDVDPQRIKESRANVAKNNVGDRATIEQKDIFTLDLSKANVITLYLLPELNVKLIPQLEKLKPGSRIVSHDFDMRGVKPKQVIHLKAGDDDGAEREHTIYLWEAPLEKEKE